ncbi:MAG: hypothetical protein MK291_03025 [Planctomycetes bacterium]|nr:hypothetical protein [Planctomycetota bacterium]
MRALAALLVLCASSCELFQPPAATPPSPWAELEAAQFGGLRNVSKCGAVWFGGGITGPDVELAYRRGVRNILDLGFPDEEPDFDLGRACFEHGIDLYDLGLLGAEALTDRNADEALDLFRDEDHHPLLVVCGTGSNSATFFALWRALDHQMPLEEAIEEARRAGMRPGPLEAFIRAQHERISRAES